MPRTAPVASPELAPDGIAAGASALGLTLPGDAIERLARFAALLQRWNAVHNLTALRSDRDILTHHLLDALSLVPRLAHWTAAPDASVLDVGSGGGLPGIPLAIACPQLRVTLIDTVQKKCAFLTQARLELALANVTVVHARVEQWHGGTFDAITARAFANLGDLVAWTRHLLTPGGHWLAMKGRVPDDELAALPADIEVRAIEPLVVPGLDEARHLIVLRPRP